MFYLILVLCVFVLFIYYRTKRFTSVEGVILFSLALVAFYLRLTLLKRYPWYSFYNPQQIMESSLLIVVPATIFITVGVVSANFRKRARPLIKLVLPYVFFGGLQQIFFLWVFTDSVYYLVHNLALVYTLSILFFVVFHLNRTSPLRRYWLLITAFALLNTGVYLFLGNIFPQILVHGVVGSVLFTVFTDTDQIKLRLG